MRRFPAALAFLASLALASTALGGSADSVVVRSPDGKEVTHRGNVTKDDAESVALQTGPATMEFRRKEIVRVKYSCLEGYYEAGQKLLEEGNLQRALDNFDRVIDDRAVPPWAKQYAYAGQAQCLERLGKPKEAVQAWVALGKEIPNNRFVREMAEGKFRAYVKLKDWQAASKALGDLQRLGEEGAFLAKVYRAQLSEEQHQYPEAAETYQGIAKARPEPPASVRGKAWAGAARCYLEAGKPADARNAAMQALRIEELDAQAAADAHLVIGECLLQSVPTDPKQLAKDENANAARDALEEILRPIVQYTDSPWAEPRALFRAGRLCEAMRDASVLGGDWQVRARWMYQELQKDKHKGTKWAAQGAARLKAMGAR